METGQIPGVLPATVARSRSLIVSVMAHSLAESAPDSRMACAWRWVLTGQGASPVSGRPGTGGPPTETEIVAEARYGVDAEPPERGWPPWRYANDPDPDRQQARRILRWLTGAADAIPVLDPGRGWHVGARFHFAHTDEEIRRVRDCARRGLAEHGDLPADRDTSTSPLSGQDVPLDPVVTLASAEPDYAQSDLISMYGVGCGISSIEEEMMTYLDAVILQGHDGQPEAEPGRYPPPQWGEGVQQAHDWVTGEDGRPPADHHGCGGYHPCPGDLRCSCDVAGYCQRGQCPACTDQPCNAFRAVDSAY